MSNKIGKAKRVYTLTPKAIEFAEALEKWCAERGIDKEDIPKLLAARRFELGDFRVEDFMETIESLVKKGYLEEAAA